MEQVSLLISGGKLGVDVHLVGDEGDIADAPGGGVDEGLGMYAGNDQSLDLVVVAILS